MRSQLANFPATTPAELAAAADAIWSQSGGQVSAAATGSGRHLWPAPLAVSLPQCERGQGLQLDPGSQAQRQQRCLQETEVEGPGARTLFLPL